MKLRLRTSAETHGDSGQGSGQGNGQQCHGEDNGKIEREHEGSGNRCDDEKDGGSHVSRVALVSRFLRRHADKIYVHFAGGCHDEYLRGTCA